MALSADNHEKLYINKNGKRVLRISEIVRILGKDQLLIWANMLGFKKILYRSELERTANIGTMVHAVLEDFADESTLTDLESFSFSDYDICQASDKLEVMNALQSFFSWYRKNSKLFKVVDTEVEMVGDMFGGTTDVVLQSPWHADRVIIGDYKTAKSVYLSMYLQTGGYIALYEELHGKNSCDGAVIFQLDKRRGKPASPKFIDRKAMQKYIDAFFALVHVATLTKDLEDSLPFDMMIYKSSEIS